MATDVDRQVARAAALLDRHSDRYHGLAGRARQYRRAGWARKARRIGIAVLALLAGAVAWGLVTPLGAGGVLIVGALVALAVLVGALAPAVPAVRREALADADIRALPLQTEIWLESQRGALPAPAVGLLDRIGVRLETLAPQMSALDNGDPAAVEIRKLLSDHLPTLVGGYRAIPAPLRAVDRNGRVPETQLVEGLGVIEQEIGAISETLAAGDLDRFATQNRFLELKYREAREIGQ